jgi:FtsP/CotA-like multicopper oxidase with cupredoxin domain
MEGKRFHRKRLVAMLLGLSLVGGVAAAEAATVNTTLYARAGTITLVDGKTLFARGYATLSGGAIQIPGPQVTANQGDTVNITLVNQDTVSHKLSVTGISVANQTVASGGSYTYSFKASQAGSRLYYDSADGIKNRVLGMYGAIVIRPTNGSNTQAWDNGPTFNQQKVWVLSTIDPRYHTVNGDSTVFASYVPKCFLINGRTGQNTNTDTAITATVGQKVLVRLINMGANPYKVSMGGLSFSVIASDGRPLPKSSTATSLTLSPGERYDLLLALSKAGTWTPKVETLDVVTGRRARFGDVQNHRAIEADEIILDSPRGWVYI